MKNIFLKTMLLLLLGFSSCTQDWKDHYLSTGSTENQGGELSIWDFIKSKPEYSKFVEIAQATGLDTVLVNDQQMTLWIPNNTALTDINGYDKEDQKLIVLNHINYIALFSNKLTDNKLIKTMAGKNMIINGSQQGWSISNCHVTKQDNACSNGVVHEIDGLMVPRKNIFEYVQELGDEYSMYRDSLLSTCQRVFRADLSFPMGVDEVGNTVYDSVFIITSPLLTSNSDIRDENKEFTFFLPSNDKIMDVFQEIKSYYPVMNDKDSLKTFNWIFKALTHKGKIEDYGTQKSLNSTFGLDWRTDIQTIEQNSKRECSNGYIYDIKYFRVPHYLFLSPVDTYPSYRVELSKQKPELVNDYFKVENDNPQSADNRPSWEKDKPWRFYFIINNSLTDNQILSLEWTSINKNRSGDVIAVPVVAGRYRVLGQFRTYGSGNLRMTVNGISVTDINDNPISFFNSGSSIYNGKLGEIGYINIPESAGVNPVRIKLEAGKPVSGTTFVKRIVVSQIRFEPDARNY